MSHRVLPPEIFQNPQRASTTLAAVREAFILSGTSRSLEEFSPVLEQRLAGVPDPDMALTNLLRFIEATVSRSALFSDLLAYPPFLDLLLVLFGSSMYLSDILVREPGLFRWLSTSSALARGPTAQELSQETQRIGSTFRETPRRFDALRRLHRREMLRIGSRDLIGRASLEQTIGDLSALADAVVDAAYDFLRADLEARYSLDHSPRFAILGLGKLGGRELNYSSDIDLLFVYEHEGELKQRDGRVVRCEEFFNRLGEHLVVRLSEQSPEGTLYRVDMRLRPESGGGPLARSLQSYLLYYESRGELWERQMLLKARVVGGSRELGQELIEKLLPFVHPRTFLQHPAESVARIKARIEASTIDPDDVKLMRGGIRDVEFTVQTIQLLAGGKNEALRTGNTLEALDRLVDHRELTADDARALRHAYELFRKLEHRLQMQLNTRTHAIPQQEEQRKILARLVGLNAAPALEEAVAAAAAGARAVFDQVLSPPGKSERSGLQAMLEGGAGADVVASLLSSYGLRDVRKALKSIRVLTSGTSLTGPGPGDTRLREAFGRIAEVLLEEIARTPSPDLTLSTLGVLVSAQRFPHQLVELLANERFRRLAVEVCSVGPRLARQLATHPILLEVLATNQSEFMRSEVGALAAGESPILWKQREELRALVRFVLGFSRFDELTGDLSAIADAILGRSLQNEMRRARVKAPLVVVAVGKYGTRELGVDADLDLFFVGRTKRTSQLTSLERCASAVVQAASAVSAEGTLFTVDTRLRPEGRNAPLVIELDSYRRYLETRASLWERQSLTRMRVVAGDADLAQEVEQSVTAFVYSSPLPATWVEDIMAMRGKTETRSRMRRHGDLDLKLGQGGLMDIEFLTQMIQLVRGRTQLELRRARVIEVLRSAPKELLSETEAGLLIAAHGLFRRAETLMRLALEERTTILPEGDALSLLASMMGRRSGEELHEEISSTMHNVRALLTTAAGRLEG